MQVKILDREAIHRNEMTNETENFSSSSEYLDDFNQKIKLSEKIVSIDLNST